jgi:hypothetical protein
MFGGVRFSLRILSKHWKLTAIAVFSVAIALAVAVLGLSVANALLLRTPNAEDPAKLMCTAYQVLSQTL